MQRGGYIAIIAAGLVTFGLYALYEAQARVQHGHEALSVELGARSDKIQEWLLRVDRTLNWFRAEDFSTSDRVAVTVRMLHTERFVAPASNLLLFSTAGRLLAATLPLPEGGGSVAAQPWFKAAQSGPTIQAVQFSECAHDPFNGGEGVMLYRAVLDHETTVGYVASFLPQAALAAMSRDDDPADGTIALALLNGARQVVGCAAAGAALPQHHRAGVLRAGLSRVIHAWPALAARSAIWEDRLIQPGDLHLIASADALDTISNEDWVALGYRFTYVVTSLAIIMALLASLLHNAGRRSRRRRALATPSNPASDGADWMWELDEAGNLVGLAGNAPDHLLPPNGRSLAEAAGPLGSSDMRWDRLNAAICGKHAFEGLLVPFQLPGREGLLTIFELSGQPVLASGGFWGTASLMSEESIATASQVRVPQPQLSIA